MTTTTIEAGAVIYLKSGGPKMTVEAIRQDRVSCSWFDGQKRMSDVFSLCLLTTDNPKKFVMPS